jgi:hypothetical protein
MRRITLRCLAKRVYVDIPDGYQVTLTPHVPATLRIYKDKQMKKIVGMFTGIVAMYDKSCVPQVAEQSAEEKEDAKEAANAMKPRVGGWRRFGP